MFTQFQLVNTGISDGWGLDAFRLVPIGVPEPTTIALMTVGAVGVTMLPVLAPFLGALLPAGLLGKYASDKLDEKAEGKGVSHSIMGVISLAKGK